MQNVGMLKVEFDLLLNIVASQQINLCLERVSDKICALAYPLTDRYRIGA